MKQRVTFEATFTVDDVDGMTLENARDHVRFALMRGDKHAEYTLSFSKLLRAEVVDDED